MTTTRILRTLLLMVLIPATAYGVLETRGPPGQGDSVKLSSLSIVAHGNATAIGMGESKPPEIVPGVIRPEPPVSLQSMQSQPEPLTASVSIKATIESRNETAVIAYNITGSSLTIGSNTYAVVNGAGIFNQHSLVVVLHAEVTSDSTSGMLILIGHADNALSGSGTVGVTFGSPQSKLAGKFFLSLKGTLTLS